MTTAKKPNWLKITLIVLCACVIAGLVLTAVLFTHDPDRTYASAHLQFSFNGAGDGKAPNGYPFNVNGIFSDEVIKDALDVAGLTDTYTIEQIRDNLTITGVYPENIVKQMTAYTSLLDKNADQQAAMTDYHATLYSVVLYHDFDTKISKGQLTNLLNSILEAYRAYFAKTCAFSLEETDPIADLQEYDYSQQLLAISEGVNQKSGFAKEMADQAPDFRKDSRGFDDIVVSYSNLKSDINRLNASITLNTISKNRDRLQKQYEMELRTLNYKHEATQEELKRIEELVASYEKDGIVYVSTSGALQKVSSNTTDTYDKLVVKHKELTNSITAINGDITKYQAMLDDLTSDKAAAKNESVRGTSETITADETEDTVSSSVKLTEEEMKELSDLTEKQIESLIAKKNNLSSDFADMLGAYVEQEINERTVMVSHLKYETPSFLSGAFIKKAIKTVGPICTVGFMICLVLMILNRRKEK